MELYQKKILDPIFDIFLENGARYNLLNSVIIELINFIRAENIRSLIHYIVTDHENKFQNIKYVQTFKALKYRWKQNQEQMKEGKDNLLMNGIESKIQDENNPKMSEELEEDMFSRESDSDEEDKDIAKKKNNGNDTNLSTSNNLPLRKDIDPDEEAKFLKGMEELNKKKKRKLDEDLNEFDFQKLGKNNNKTRGTEDLKMSPINTNNKLSRNSLQNKPLSPPTSVVGGGGTYIQTEGSPKRRRGSK